MDMLPLIITWFLLIVWIAGFAIAWQFRQHARRRRGTVAIRRQEITLDRFSQPVRDWINDADVVLTPEQLAELAADKGGFFVPAGQGNDAA